MTKIGTNTRESASSGLVGSSGGWVRVTRYELRDGFIRPASGQSPVAYDPWDLYRAARERGRAASREDLAPHESLLRLLREAERFGWEGSHGPLSPEVGQMVVEWCNQFGLLGLMLDQVDTILLDAFWRRSEVDQQLVPWRTVFQSGRWATTSGWDRFETIVRVDEKTLVAPPGAQPGTLASRGRVELRGDGPMERSLDWLAENFFPDYREDPNREWIPRPLTEAFWLSYSEEAHAILSVAENLDEILRHLPSLGPARWLDRFGEVLLAILRPVNVALHLGENGNFVQRWECPTLLSSLFMMAYSDMVAGRPWVECAMCGSMFAGGSRGWQKFCTVECQRAHSVRERTRRRRQEMLGQIEIRLDVLRAEAEREFASTGQVSDGLSGMLEHATMEHVTVLALLQEEEQATGTPKAPSDPPVRSPAKRGSKP